MCLPFTNLEDSPDCIDIDSPASVVSDLRSPTPRSVVYSSISSGELSFQRARAYFYVAHEALALDPSPLHHSLYIQASQRFDIIRQLYFSGLLDVIVDHCDTLKRFNPDCDLVDSFVVSQLRFLFLWELD